MNIQYKNECILVEKYPNKVAKITLNNPPLNIFSLSIMEELHYTLKKINKDDDVRTVVICGNERAFSVGSNIKEVHQNSDDVVGKKLLRENEAFNILECGDKFSIAVIEGVVSGGGLELSIACDMRVMANNARAAFGEVNVGLRPGSGGCFRLPKLVGPSKALELMCLGEFISAEECLRIGLVNRLAETGKGLELGLELADKVARKSQTSVRLIRKSVRELWLKTSEECFWQNLHHGAELYDTEDWKEGVNSFIEKRKPNFD